MNKKLNNKGYMLVEIIVASVIAFSVAYYLLNLTYKFKDKNMDVYESTSLLSNKINITKNIMYDLNDQNVTKITTVNDNNYDLTITNPDKSTTTKRISVNGKTIEYGTLSGDTIIKNDRSYYKKELPNYVDIGKISVFSESKIQIPISDIYSNNTYDINIGTTNLDWTPIYHVFISGMGGFISSKIGTNKIIEYDGRYNNIQESNPTHIVSTTWKDLNDATAPGADAKIEGSYTWNDDNLEFLGNTKVTRNSSVSFSDGKYTIECTFELKEQSTHQKEYLIGNINETSKTGIALLIDENNIPILKGYYESSGEKSLSGTTPLKNGVKYQVVGLYDKEKIKLFINGILNNSITETNNITNSTNNLALGVNPTARNGGYFLGKMYSASIGRGIISEDIIKASAGIDVKLKDKYAKLFNPPYTTIERYGNKTKIDKWWNGITQIQPNTEVKIASDHTVYITWK